MFFSSPTSLNTIYIPSAADLANGSVSLILTAYPEAPCSDSVTSMIVRYFIPSPLVDAGPGGTICETDHFTIPGANVTGANISKWTTNGDGDFSDPNSWHLRIFLAQPILMEASLL